MWGVHWQLFWVFQLFQIISDQCGSKSPTIANLAKMWLWLIQNGQIWLFCMIFVSFPPKMRLGLTQNCQFHPIHNFSHLLPPKHLIFGEISKILISGGGYICKFFEFSNFFKSFHTNVAQNHPQLQIWPKKWLRLGQNSQIKSFCRIFYDSPHLFSQNEAEIDSKWSISPDSQLFPSFSTKAFHSGEIPKIFISGGENISKFFE